MAVVLHWLLVLQVPDVEIENIFLMHLETLEKYYAGAKKCATVVLRERLVFACSTVSGGSMHGCAGYHDFLCCIGNWRP